MRQGGPSEPENQRDPATEEGPAKLLQEPPTLTISPSASQPETSNTKASTLSVGENFGPYRILRILGRGGMGTVYEAEHVESGRRVALKILSQALATSVDRERFLREGRLAASISHPHNIYIYGTEEIDGTAVITMELVAGGTLKERVQEKGPLSPAAAVDAILQVISGLQAAESLGVLHRDVKPSNCFVARDGMIKIGDFGLSISTFARQETNLTLAGTILGTPAFASPEQLRGEELDVRSDIYSVGATLYFLLTGRAPFEEQRIVQLLATVLERAPASPQSLRREIPAGLAALVLRCLKKDRSARFLTYEALEKDLLPFSSVAPTPATLGLRLAAGVIDAFTLSSPALAYISLRGLESANLKELYLVGAFSLGVSLLYFTFLEGVWGAAIGKGICGLRVVGPDKNIVGVPRSFFRTSVFLLLPFLPLLVLIIVSPWDRPIASTTIQPIWLVIARIGHVLSLLLLFSTARRRNGYAAVHELLSKTRVVLKSAYQARAIVRTTAPSLPVAASSARIGPYVVVSTLAKSERSECLLGFDESLRRKTWIQLVPPNSPALPAARCDLSRPGRLHWLNGRRTGQECWDAYEAPGGTPFLVRAGESWSVVRHWLLDLAEELDDALKDGSLACVGLDRIWITADNRAKLLDFPAPGAASYPTTELADLGSALGFLNETARYALGDSSPAPQQKSSGPLPLHARDFLKQLGERNFKSLDSLIVQLRSFLRQNAVLSRKRRLAHVALCSLMPAYWILVVTMGMGFFSRQSKMYPDITPLRHCLQELEILRREIAPNDSARAQRQRRALEIYIAARFRGTITDPTQWSSLYVWSLINTEQRKIAEDLVATYPQSSEEDVTRAAQDLKDLTGEISPEKPLPSMFTLAMLTIGWGLTPAIILGIASAFIFRGGPYFQFLGIAVVTKDGRPASRLRTLWRSFFVWLPCIPVSPLIGILGVDMLIVWQPAVVTSLGVLFVAGAVWAIWIPERGLQDRLAGTFLVPR